MEVGLNMNTEQTKAMRLEIGNVANALRVLRTRVGAHRVNEAEIVAVLAEIEKRVEPLEAALWTADVLGEGEPKFSDRPEPIASKKTSGSLIYLMSPYSDPDPAVRQARFEAACKAATALMQNGGLVYSPVIHKHSLFAHGLPACNFRFWERLDEAILSACTSVVVLMLPGWLDGFGIELAIACKLGLPIRHIFPGEFHGKGTQKRCSTAAVFN